MGSPVCCVLQNMGGAKLVVQKPGGANVRCCENKLLQKFWLPD
jgi:hypothetical protein